ncbi:DUF559 domain-containing protein [uncultured Microbacterium sp.]|uniref:DUF559 domain-containing protein n=1 Tax=uncultured Microbacterium sp. TaxID=191216 RepID=UPI0028D26984|nr:DUF559 domain-containing protein [uncultured Microbacterium sp.]
MRTSEVIDLTEQLGGVIRRSALVRRGASKRDIAVAVAGGGIMRLREGVYAVPTADPNVLDAARHGGEVACISALRALGIWVLDKPDRLHVWLGGKGRRHQHSKCTCIDHHDAGGAAFGIARAALALVQAAACCDDEVFFAAYESAWKRGMLSRTDREWIRRAVPARIRWLVDLARADADSGLESLLRLRLIRLGVSLECQVLVVGVGRVDFVAAGVLIIEVDGRENHDGQSLRHKDLVRDAAAAALGYETLRFDYALVVHEWRTVERAIVARLRRHGVPVVGSTVTEVN